VLFLFTQVTKYIFLCKGKKNIKTHAAKTHHRSIPSAGTVDDFYLKLKIKFFDE